MTFEGNRRYIIITSADITEVHDVVQPVIVIEHYDAETAIIKHDDEAIANVKQDNSFIYIIEHDTTVPITIIQDTVNETKVFDE